MSPQESRILWCLVEGDPTPYYVYDIPIGANVTQLKGLITKSIESPNNIKSHHLDLWKLNEMVPIDPDKSLVQRLEALGDIDAYSSNLSSGEIVGELFPEPPSHKHFHIVVQRPSSPSASRKRLRSATEEDGQAVKRKEIEGDVLDVKTRCEAIHGAIKAMPDNLDLSDPSKITALPFPSPFSMPFQRFQSKEIKGIKHFEYMGRSQFHQLQKRLESETFLERSESLYLYGTSGSGKSHLLAALVFQLVRARKRVFYIPDCSRLLQDPTSTMWAAYHFAFYESPALGTIIDPHNVDAWIRSMGTNLYVIVDQVNALETTPDDSLKEMKVQALRWLGILRENHRYIFSASANEISNREAYRTQSGISVIPIFGGMSEAETEQWFILHDRQIPRLSDEQRRLVEHLTGRIPLLLRHLFNMANFDEQKFREITDLRNVGLQVSQFFRTKYESQDPLSQKTYLGIMKACVRGGHVWDNDRSLYDLRHFFVDQEGTGHFTCGFAFEAMTLMLRMYGDVPPFLEQSWYDAVSQFNNPVFKGFLAEQICLSNIASNGLTAVDQRLGQMSTANFEGDPDFGEFLSTDHTTCLYIPIRYNFVAVDGVILLLDRQSRDAVMFPLQFTLSQSHEDSDKQFHTMLWPKWSEQIISAGFKVQSTFVWIDKKQPLEQVKVLRSHNKVISPKHSVIRVGVEKVDSKLASALNIKQ
ncbi:hypothetical protein BGW80DRAFT_1451367 [Lactifluus volemus]|nr:hypothetical protein BGW80DRAFT_1451367 [Lactifluus volemus]